MTAVLTHFDTGAVEALGSVRSPGPMLEQLRAEWPVWCKRVGLASEGVEPGTVIVPRLLDWRRVGHGLELWTIGVPGVFGVDHDRSPKAIIPSLLASSRRDFGAVEAHGVEVDPGVLEVLVSARRLPERIDFDLSMVPAERDRVMVGRLADGSSALWDLNDRAHGLFTGQNGSGKTELASVALAQFHLKGWRIVGFSPKVGDPALSAFADRHQILTGQTDDDLAEMVDLWRDLEIDRAHRQKLQAEHRVRRWIDMPADVLAEYPPLVVVVDESRSFFIGHKGESRDRLELKSEILSSWVTLVQAGRSAGHHGLMVTQSADVESLGGGFAAEQLGAVVALRSLPRKWWPTVFPSSEADLSLLQNPKTKPGRGIVRGVVTPGTVFGAAEVNDVAVQAPLVSPDLLERLLSDDAAWVPETPGPVELWEPAPAVVEPVQDRLRPAVIAIIAGWVVWILFLLIVLAWAVSR